MQDHEIIEERDDTDRVIVRRYEDGLCAIVRMDWPNNQCRWGSTLASPVNSSASVEAVADSWAPEEDARARYAALLDDERPPIAQQAAEAFHEAAVAVLEARGERATAGRIAEIVGEAAPNYSAARKGRRGSLDRVQGWLDAWAAAGLPRLALGVGPGWVRVVPEDELALQPEPS